MLSTSKLMRLFPFDNFLFLPPSFLPLVKKQMSSEVSNQKCEWHGHIIVVLAPFIWLLLTYNAFQHLIDNNLILIFLD